MCPMLAQFAITIAGVFAGAIIGFFSSIYASRILEKHRVIRALISGIECVRTECRADNPDFSGIHTSSKPILKPLCFAAIPYLTSEGKKNEARDAWIYYQGLVKPLYDAPLPKVIDEAVRCSGEIVINKFDILDGALDKLQDAFENEYW